MARSTSSKTIQKSRSGTPFVRRQWLRARAYYKAYVNDTPIWWQSDWAKAKPDEMAPGVEMIIFSKNRACQLDQLIRSLVEFVEELDLFNITIVYVADSKNFEEGYKLVQSEFRFLNFVEQRSDQPIGQQVQNLLDASKKEFLCILVDDDVVIRRLSLRSPQFEIFRTDLSISSLSIRLSRFITFCQPLGIAERPPYITKDGVFHWYVKPFWRLVRDVSRKFGQPQLGVGDWCVSMSMDGNFFRLSEFREYFRHLPEMKRFGDIELTMVRTPIPREYGICFDEAKLINLPLNSVRDDYKYPNMEINGQYLNGQLLSGHRLDYGHLRSINSSSCHLETAPGWIEPTPPSPKGG